MGKKIIKFLSITVVVLVLIVIGLTVFVKIYVTPERVKTLLVAQAESTLNRRVTIGEININVLQGISVTDFAVKEADEKTDFVSCRDFVLKFKLLPLLSKQLIIDELRLVAPTVRIERSAEGRFNFDDIGKGKEKKPEEVKEAGEPGGMPVSLLVSNVSVRDSSFSLIDHTKNIPNMKGTLSVEMTMQPSAGGELFSQGNIDVMLEEMTRWKPRKETVKDIKAGIQYSARVYPGAGGLDLENADLTIQDIQASLKGKTKNLTTSPDIDVTLSMKDVKTADVQDLLSSFIDLTGLSLSGSFSTDVNVKGKPQKLDTLASDGTVIFKKTAVAYDKISAALDGIVAFKTSADTVFIDTTGFHIQEIPASVKGTLKDISTSPSFDIAVSVPKVKATLIQQAVAPFTGLLGVGVSGALTAHATIRGKAEDLSTIKADGDVTFEKLGIKYQDVDAMLDGALALKEDLMTIDLNAAVGENKTSLKGSVKNLFKNQDITMNIYSGRLNIEKLIPPVSGKEGSASTAKGTSTGTVPSEAEPLDLKLTARGEIKVDSALYKGLTMKNLNMKYEFRNNRLNVSTLTGSAGKGTFDLISGADLSIKGYRYNLAGRVDSLYAEEIINAFFPKYKDTIYGIVSTNIKVNGKGTLPESMKRNLAGNLDFTLRDGKITNIPMLNNLAAILNTKELQTINVRRGNGTLSLANGRAKLDSLITSDEIEMDPKGNVEIVDETLDLAFDLKLSPRLKGKAMSSSYSEYLSDRAGWGMIPVKCPGTFSNPRCGPDLAKAGKRAVEKEIDKQIDKIFKKKEGEESPETEAVKELLKGIFSK